jgi:hypothetical protein
MATITCKCGKVRLALPNVVPRLRSGCCCSECLQRAYIGCGGKPPAAVANLDEPVDLFYIDSQIMPPDRDTLANLAVFKLNKADAANINLRATCCGAVLCTENQEFHIPHTMATFNNLRPFLRCEFSAIPASTMNIFTMDWPEAKRQALASREALANGRALPQIFDPKSALDEQPIRELIAAMQAEPQTTADNAISFAELREGMAMNIEHAYFEESRTHPGNTGEN